MTKTEIEWATDVWNPTAGCDRVSPGCDHCYAMTMAKRLKGMGQAKYQLDGDPRTSGPGFLAHEWPDALNWPLTVAKPMRVFVNSMSDLFHDRISDEYIVRVFAVMALAPQHTFQVLTKRHARMRSLLSDDDFEATVAQTVVGWSVEMGIDLPEHLVIPERPSWYPLPNVWLGVSVENQQWADIRVPALLDTPAAVRFLSCEPLLGPVDLLGRNGPGCENYGPAITHEGYQIRTDYGTGVDYGCEHQVGIDWVIVGGESGPAARPMHLDWARSLRDQCANADVPFLFKQWGGRTPKTAGRELDGRTWDQYPTAVTA